LVLIDLTSINPELNSKNANKDKRIDELHSQKESAYHKAIDAATEGHEKNSLVKYAIQEAALALEEIYQLHDQSWMTQQIGCIIVKDLKTRGFPESKYKYVYEALSVYDDRFVQKLEHSSSQTVSPLTKHQELYYRTNAQRYYQALDTLRNLSNDYDNLLKRDIQSIVPRLLDYYDTNEKECKHRLILFEKNKQDGFDGGPEKYQDPIRIHKGIPKVPIHMAEELNIWITTFLPALLKKFTDYPLKDEKLEKRMAAGWAALRHAHDPSTDDKYRKSYYDWITIVEFADSSFKHHAASKFKTQDDAGRWRKLTREQIGARQKSMKDWCKWFFETIPGFMEEITWSRNYREPALSAFSIDLGPKLSDRSIR
jgi:hypothetical protein